MTVPMLIQDTTDFLTFLKSRSPLYHCSNVFFRDFQYGIMAFAEQKGVRVSYARGEELAWEIVAHLTGVGILRPVKPGSWMLNYDSFRKPSAKAEAVPKVNAAAAPVKPAVA